MPMYTQQAQTSSFARKGYVRMFIRLYFRPVPDYRRLPKALRLRTQHPLRAPCHHDTKVKG